MSASTIPSEVRTEVAIEGAQREISSAQGVYGIGSLNDKVDGAGRMMAHLAMKGDDLSLIRSFAIQAALIRDAMPTSPEWDVKRAA